MAVTTKVEICNLALDHIGKPSITSLDEGSKEAQACLRQYDVSRRMCLSRSPWTFARRLRAMPLLTDNPLSDLWEYRFDLPNDLLKVIRLTESGRDFTGNSLPPASYIESGSIYTNAQDVKLFYLWDSADVKSWSPMFDDVVALFLAMRLTPGATRRKADTTMLKEMYTSALGEAIEVDAQQETSLYTFHEGGYVDARGPGSSRRDFRMLDGSTIWE